MTAAQKAFPSSQVYFAALNNYPVPSLQQANLKDLNNIVHYGYKEHVLTPIPADQFKTEPDGIHWTQKTANNILCHWIQVLN